MLYVAAYLIVGLTVAAVVYSRRNRPREKEIGSFMLLLSDPLVIWLPILLWPLWLALMAIPQKAFVEEKMSAPAEAEILVGRSGVVVIPLTPVGRVSIDGVHRDARAEFGSIPTGASVVVCAHGIGSELIVTEKKGS